MLSAVVSLLHCVFFSHYYAYETVVPYSAEIEKVSCNIVLLLRKKTIEKTEDRRSMLW